MDRVKQLVSPLGIDVLLNPGTNQGGVFDRVTASAGDTIGKHLMALATQRSVLLSSNEDGSSNLVYKITQGKFGPGMCIFKQEESYEVQGPKTLVF